MPFVNHPTFKEKGTNVNSISEVLQKVGLQSYYDYYTRTYFRHFYIVLNLSTQTSGWDYEKQYQYASFLRATLSRCEFLTLQ